MANLKRVKELEAQLASDKKEVQGLEKREEILLHNIPRKGFKAAVERRKIEDKIRAINEADRKKKHRVKDLS